MAHKINKLIKEKHKDDSFLLLCSIGHMAYGLGVPERIWSKNPELQEETLMSYVSEQGLHDPPDYLSFEYEELVVK